MLFVLCIFIGMRSDVLDKCVVDFVVFVISYFGEDEEFYIFVFEVLI